MTKRQCARMACFVLAAACMLGLLANFLRDRETTLSSLYSEPKNSVDVFVVGSSHVNSGIIPGLLWEEYEISAHNVFSWSQPMWISYHYIIEALKTQSPKVVVLNMHGAMYGNSSQQPEDIDDVNYKNSFSIDPGLNFYRMIQTVATAGIDLRDPVDFLNLVRYHSSWKYINEGTFTYSAHKQQSYLKGYGIQVQQYEGPAPEAADTQDVTEPYEKCVEYLDKIVALSEKEGFQLVFAMVPYIYQPNEPALFNWIQSYADEHGIPFLNYCTTEGARIGFDWQDGLSDANHLNYRGAVAVTRDLGAYLAANYSFRTREQLPNSGMLDVDAAKMRRTLELNHAVLGGTESFLAWMAENGLAFARTEQDGEDTLATYYDEVLERDVFLFRFNADGTTDITEVT